MTSSTHVPLRRTGLVLLTAMLGAAIAGTALTYGVQAVSAQEGPATLAVSPEVARQVEMQSFDARPATLAVSPEVARQVELGAFDARPATLAVSPEVAGEVARQLEVRLDSQGVVQSSRQPVPAPISVTSSGSEIGWPQVGIGFGIGIVLALGLFVGLRMSRTRHLAH